jgi:hypothetical protein
MAAKEKTALGKFPKALEILNQTNEASKTLFMFTHC